MDTSEFDLKNRSDRCPAPMDEFRKQTDAEYDSSAEGLLENINSTPIGQLLKIISSLPEIRREKVVDLRHQISKGQYNLGDNLDTALDRVIEELITEG